MRWLDAIALRIYRDWKIDHGASPGARWGSVAVVWLLCLLVVTVLPVVVYRWLPPPISAFMAEDRMVASLRHDGDYHLRYSWTGWDRISPSVRLAVVASEDQKFPTHHGFDFEAISDAWAEYQNGEGRRGGSTISQQVARNMFLWRGGGFFRKGLEAYFTVLIETLWPKRRILEVYLNVAEFGDGVYGVGAASQAYFGTSPARLTSQQAALLAAVLPSPRRMRPDTPSEYVHGRARDIMTRMSQLGSSHLDGL